MLYLYVCDLYFNILILGRSVTKNYSTLAPRFRLLRPISPLSTFIEITYLKTKSFIGQKRTYVRIMYIKFNLYCSCLLEEIADVHYNKTGLPRKVTSPEICCDECGVELCLCLEFTDQFVCNISSEQSSCPSASIISDSHDKDATTAGVHILPSAEDETFPQGIGDGMIIRNRNVICNKFYSMLF